MISRLAQLDQSSTRSAQEVTLPPEAESNHYPTGQDEDWQESWACAWYDPLARVGGWHHVGLARVREQADLWSCIWIDGEFVHRFQKLDLAIPDQELTDLRLGPLHLWTEEPLLSHGIALADADHDLSARIECQRAVDPIAFSYSAAKGHWEVYGCFSGELRVGQSKTPVKGHSFVDRSWGKRDWSDILTYRLIWAMFGSDLAFKLYVMRCKSGSQIFGVAMIEAEQIAIRHVEIDVVMHSDGISPKGAEITVFVENGRIYSFAGRCDGSDVGVQRDGFMCGHGNATFECGGRLGTGFIEAKELSVPPAELASLIS